MFQHVFEVSIRRFVRSYVFSRVYGVKLDTETVVAVFEAVVIDVGQDRELIVLF